MIKILLAEDDPLMSRMYQRLFDFEGYQVDLAVNGLECVEKAKANQPMLILMDIMMPKMNGLEALDKLKEDPDTKDIPVVVLTNLAGQQDAEEAMARGAIRYIVKSENDPKDIAEIVKEIVTSLK